MQNISEFWNVCTRPVANNGLGLTLEATARHLKRIERLFVRLPDSENHYAVWRDLVFRERVLGVRVHDAKLVALMMLYDIDKILTFNTRDFARYPKIEPVSPLDV
jgi:predicted nucleic acid-binding protein